MLRSTDGGTTWTAVPLPDGGGTSFAGLGATFDRVGGWYVGGNNNWGGMSVDERRGIVYVPTGSPTYDFYGADRGRIEIVPPGVDHAFFAPGDRRGARWALGLGAEPVLLFVGRIQPLKGVDVAVEALARLERDDTRLWIVGGASGTGDMRL